VTSSYVYFIQVQPAGPVKIGIATDPHRRIVKIQSDCPWRVRLIGAIKGAKEKEKEIHLCLAHWRTQGEWFEPSAEVISRISDELANGCHLPPKDRRPKYSHPLCE
jgi:hypothetical protein